MIERAGLEIGDRLPPEVSLAEQLGVGRSTIREALNRWEGLGLIRRRRGDGTYLSARVQATKGPVSTMLRLEGEALLRLIEVRRALEGAVVRLAAERATTRQKAEFGQLLHNLDQAFERSQESPFGRDEFGLRSFPLHRRLCDEIVANNPDGAFQAIHVILDSVEAEVRQIIAEGLR